MLTVGPPEEDVRRLGDAFVGERLADALDHLRVERSCESGAAGEARAGRAIEEKAAADAVRAIRRAHGGSALRGDILKGPKVL